MFRKISNALHRYSNGQSLLLFLALMVLFATVIVPTAQSKLMGFSNGVDLIDLLLSYSPDTVYRMIEAYGDEGRPYYRNFAMSFDLAYPVVYSVFLSLLIGWLLQRVTPAASRWRLLNLLPFGGMLFDWLENASVIAMLTSYPAVTPNLARIGSLCTSLKWGFSALSMLLLVSLLVLAARKFISERRRAS